MFPLGRSKVLRHRSYKLLRPLPILQKPWSSISMDFITNLPSSKAFDSIFVVVDQLTKMAYFMPCNKTVTGEETTRLFMDNIYKYHGLLDDIISDHGSQFTSKFWQSLFKILKIKIKLSSTYHPQIDGQTERVNQVLEQYLSCTIKTIGWSYYYLPNLCTTIQSKDLFSRPHSLPTMGTTQSSISSTSTKWKIQLSESLLSDCQRFIRR